MGHVGDYIIRAGTYGKAVVDVLGTVFCDISIFESYFFMKFVLETEKERERERELSNQQKERGGAYLGSFREIEVVSHYPQILLTPSLQGEREGGRG